MSRSEMLAAVSIPAVNKGDRLWNFGHGRRASTVTGEWEEGDSRVTGGSGHVRGKIGHGAIQGDKAGWLEGGMCAGIGVS